jgi:Cu+-exporting ATPase
MVGHYLESRAVTKAAADLNFVLASNQKPRLVLGSEVTLPAGEEINGDGEIIWGDGLIDESLLTGESKPIPKGVGDKVFGGTHLLSGTIRYRVNAVGSNSALGKVLQLVERAYVDRPAIQALGDRAAKIFIPSIIIVSLLTLLSALLFLPLHEALIRSIAVLVVACPCAVGLATPTAVMAGVGRAAKRGIIFKGGAPLETLANIEAIAFDKTGTLTEVSKGIPDLEVLSAGEKYDLAELTKIAVTLEEHSSHPLSKAIRLLGNSDPETLAEAREVVGEGVYGKGKDGREFFIGLSPKERTFSVTLSIDGEVVCGFRFADATKATLKEGAKEIVTYFRKVLREVYLLSGDSLPAVKQVGEALNLDEKNVMGELLPEDKLKALSEIQKSYKVCFVGDGINDAPSLAKADVGIAIGGGSDSALRSARVILLKGDLFLLKEAIQISKATYTTIKQNLWWAFIYNLSLVPFAAFGFISPTFAALAMGASDLLIVGNSIRLSTKKF